MQPFNILYLNSHDTGRAVEPLGFPVAMPNLTRFARQGITFRNNFCVAPTCSPSRAALVTGCYPHENGMWGLAHRGFRLFDYKQHWIHTLHTAGYTSTLAGFQHVARKGEVDQPDWRTIGYHHEAPNPNLSPDERVLAFLEKAPQQPFYLEAGFSETHREFPTVEQLQGDAAYDPDHTATIPPLPDTPGVRQDVARYKASARILDRKWGRIFEALERTGLAANTLVIATTDHGIAFPRMKCHLQDSGTGTFLIMRGPGGFSGGRTIDALTTHLDLFPTVCALAGIQPPAWLRGKSLLPLVQGTAPRLHEAVFGEINFHAAAEPVRCVRTERYKYIRRFDGRTTPVLPNCDDGESKTDWLAAGWATRPFGIEQLYDLAFDSAETDDRAEDPAYAPALAQMRGRLEAWMKATNDPLLQGALVPPPGAVLNDVNGRSPRETPIKV